MGRRDGNQKRNEDGLLESSVFCLPGELRLQEAWLVLCLEADRCQSLPMPMCPEICDLAFLEVIHVSLLKGEKKKPTAEQPKTV